MQCRGTGVNTGGRSRSRLSLAGGGGGSGLGVAMLVELVCVQPPYGERRTRLADGEEGGEVETTNHQSVIDQALVRTSAPPCRGRLLPSPYTGGGSTASSSVAASGSVSSASPDSNADQSSTRLYPASL